MRALETKQFTDLTEENYNLIISNKILLFYMIFQKIETSAITSVHDRIISDTAKMR